VARAAAGTGRFDAVVALGAVVRGDTYHFEVVSDASAAGLMQLSLDSDVVITNAILTVDDEAQAIARAGDDDGNKGAGQQARDLAALETDTGGDRVDAGGDRWPSCSTNGSPRCWSERYWRVSSTWNRTRSPCATER
jgi:hypothetical protein